MLLCLNMSVYGEYRFLDSDLQEGGKKEVVGLFEEGELVDCFPISNADTSEVFPYHGIVEIPPGGMKIFGFYRVIYTFVNITETPIQVLLFNDEGCACFGIIKSWGTLYGRPDPHWGVHHDLPYQDESMILDGKWN